MNVAPGEWKTSDIARRHGVSQRTARRWLGAIERAYGPKVVTRRGKVLVTTPHAFGEVAPLVADALTNPAALEKRIAELEEQVREQQQRIDGMQREFRGKAHAWFTRAK